MSKTTENSRTPRTDAVWRITEPLGWMESFANMHDHAEALERDLTAALADKARLEARCKTLRELLEMADDSMHCIGNVSPAHRELVSNCYEQIAVAAALTPPAGKGGNPQ